MPTQMRNSFPHTWHTLTVCINYKLLLISTDIPWVSGHYVWKLLIEELLDGNPSISVIGKKGTWDNWTGLHCQYLCWHCIDKIYMDVWDSKDIPHQGGSKSYASKQKSMSPVSQVCMILYLGYYLFLGSWSCSMWLNHAARVMYDTI